MCKVTVITVTYNAEMCIEETMNSVISQKDIEFEYVIKDGDSSDSTNDIVNSVIQKCKNEKIKFKHIVSRDKGIYDAMNEAVREASGKWIIFMNAGDVFYNANVLSDVFSKQYEEYIGVLCGHAMMKLRKNRNIVVTNNPDWLYQGVSICHQSVFEKRKHLLQYPFDTEFKILADRAHFLELKKVGVPFYEINSIIVKEDRNGISSVNYPQTFREAEVVNKRYELNCRNSSTQVGWLKMLIKKRIPIIEEWVMLSKAMKRMGKVIDEKS